jgi:hypothetical protein
MRHLFRRFIGLATILSLTVVACGDDPTGNDSGDELSSTEVAAVLTALESALASVNLIIGGGGPVTGPARVPIPVNESDEGSFLCESGTVEVSASLTGSFDDETQEDNLTTTVSFDPKACVVGDGTKTLTLDGDPSVEFVLNSTSTQDGRTTSGTEKGGFSFTSSDGRSGSCALDVTFSSTFESGLVSIDTPINSTITGTICGLSASGFQTLGTATATAN